MSFVVAMGLFLIVDELGNVHTGGTGLVEPPAGGQRFCEQLPRDTSIVSLQPSPRVHKVRFSLNSVEQRILWNLRKARWRSQEQKHPRLRPSEAAEIKSLRESRQDGQGRVV